jgi:ABC-type metal ion transport system substrate-binding protein
MKVAQLIAMLEGEDQDAEVHFAYNYGDHWRTEVAPAVSNVTVGIVEFSDYHRMDKLVDDEDCYDEETGDYREDVRKVVVLA